MRSSSTSLLLSTVFLCVVVFLDVAVVTATFIVVGGGDGFEAEVFGKLGRRREASLGSFPWRLFVAVCTTGSAADVVFTSFGFAPTKVVLTLATGLSFAGGAPACVDDVSELTTARATEDAVEREALAAGFAVVAPEGGLRLRCEPAPPPRASDSSSTDQTAAPPPPSSASELGHAVPGVDDPSNARLCVVLLPLCVGGCFGLSLP